MYIEDIKQFAKNEKELVTLLQVMRICNQEIGTEFGIQKLKMLITRCGKLQMTDRMKLSNQEKKIRTLGEKETFKYFGILKVDTINQVEMKEKNLKRVYQKNEKTTRNQTVSKKSHPRDKHLGCPPCKILGIILKVDERKTSARFYSENEG